MMLAWVLLGLAVGAATTGPGGLTRRGLFIAVAFLAAMSGLLITDQDDALAGIGIGFGVAAAADGVRAVVSHWRHTKPGPEP